MNNLFALGYTLKPGAPNADGLCKFKIIDVATGATVAFTDTYSTVEDALTEAVRFANEELQEEQ